MTLATLLSFLLILYLRKALKDAEPKPLWYPYLNLLLFAILVLFLVQVVLRPGPAYGLLWPLLLFAIIYVLLRNQQLASSRNLVIAVIPLAVLSFLEVVFRLWNFGFDNDIWKYLGVAHPFAFIWAGAFFYQFRKQQKALAEERKKREEEEEQSKLIAARKDELELLVAERTAEITKQNDELQLALDQLKATQSQLIHAEKMASLGELTAGIAHEIQNPLNFVNNFSEVSHELLDEMKAELEKGNHREVSTIAGEVIQNLEKISYHGKRADAIVKGMLYHSRASSGQKEPTDINALADEYLRLAYHGLRAKDKSFNAKFETDFDADLEHLQVAPQDIGRVILNLINNAFYAVWEKKKKNVTGYEPVVRVSTRTVKSGIEIMVQDNGSGMPDGVMEKMFQPFFTTKPAGKGTGLGLSISYEIIKAHGGELSAESTEGEGSSFKIFLPR